MTKSIHELGTWKMGVRLFLLCVASCQSAADPVDHPRLADGASVQAGVSQGPVAVITGGPFSGPAPLSVYLDATTSHTTMTNGWISAFSWDLGDGTTTTDGYFTHTFKSSGTYTVTLTVADGTGATARATQLVSVSGSTSTDAGSSECTAVITGGPFSGPAPLVAFLDATTSHCSSRSDWITGFSWSLGDGSTSKAGYLEHSYASSGSYQVTLTVTDENGRTSSTLQDIGVGTDAPWASPTAVITGGPFLGDLPATNYLDATTSTVGGTDNWIAAYHWDLGDGTSSSAGFLTHQFPGAGRYEVALTVTDSVGKTGTTYQFVEVGTGSQLPFVDGFQELNNSWLPGGWFVPFGRPYIFGGQLRPYDENPDYGFWTGGPKTYDSVIATVDTGGEGVPFYVALLARADPSNPTQSHYRLLLLGGSIIIQRVSPTDVVNLYPTAEWTQGSGPHVVKFELTGVGPVSFQILVDGALVLQDVDSSAEAIGTSGWAGVWFDGQNATPIGDFEVR